MPVAPILIALRMCAFAALAMAAIHWSAPASGPGGGVALAQGWTLARTFLNPTPADGDNFGYSVAAVGTNVLVGAPFDDAGATDAGAAYLFDGASGTLLRTFSNPTPAIGDWFGVSVAALGSNVLVGARQDDTGATDAGAAYLFDGATGALLRTFLNPTPAASDLFGYPVAAVGGNVIIGAIQDDTAGTDAGAAYLFDGSSGALLRTFTNPTPAPNDWFGYRVAALGSNVLVAAPLDSAGASNAGVVHLFDASSGALLRTFQKPAPAASDRFGWSVAALGGNVLVGVPLDNAGATDAGAAYLFNGASGALLRTFFNPAPAVADNFGWSVAAVGSNVLVGGVFDDSGATDTGAAYLFDAGNGVLIHTFSNPTPSVGDSFGWWAAAVGGSALIGAPDDNAGAADSGAAHLFQGPIGGLAGPAVVEAPLEAQRSPWLQAAFAAAIALCLALGGFGLVRAR